MVFTEPTVVEGHKRGENQIHRTRVREVRIQFPPAVSQVRTASTGRAIGRRALMRRMLQTESLKTLRWREMDSNSRGCAGGSRFDPPHDVWVAQQALWLKELADFC
jgi:hypothetical protein